jgi:C4-dicarboxylate-binding protein DctP
MFVRISEIKSYGRRISSMKKKNSVTLLIMSVCLVLVLAVLPSVARAKATAAKPIVLRYAGGMPIDGFVTNAMNDFAERVSKKTNGGVKIEVYPAAQLYGHKKAEKPLLQGVIDLAQFTAADVTDLEPAINLGTLGIKNLKELQAICASDEVFRIVDESLQLKGLKLLFWMPYGLTGGPLTRKKPVRTLADLEGLKIRVAGESPAAIVRKLGGITTMITSAEVYTALTRGTVDGVYSGMDAYVSFKWYEQCKYCTDFVSSVVSFYTLCNLKSWERLPEDIRQVMLKSGKEVTAAMWPPMIKTMGELWGDMEKGGVTRITLSPEEEAKWHERIAPLWKEWAARSAAGTKIFHIIQEMRK